MRALMPTFDCIQDYEQARADRLWDGTGLWSLHRHAGGVYLLGYSAEIALKCACFRCMGFSIVQPIGVAELRTAHARARLLGVIHPPEGFHNVRFWADLLVAQRAAATRPLDPAVAGALAAAADAVHRRWWIEMRYKRAVTTNDDVEHVAAAVDWIDRNYHLLHS